ncbi:hypothetical protein PFNF135_00471 [Plasmodium falciparum NF135/5.C10]|uniref:Glutaredoxin domain-containing protein n=1 Tax=Plasmodium falciparum NF135/5.C10 TaxID=1036726 RepID=W4IP08_PLAFA|nr:hypothetical protein PFNF135_00471 [Plasmodium falciparum NF135/5.C10]
MAGTSEAVKKWVNKIIEENIIAVFAKTECPYCIKAISILKGYNLNSHMVKENDEGKLKERLQKLGLVN